MFTLLLVFAFPRIPVPEPASASASGARAGEQRFDVAWQDTVAVIPPSAVASLWRDGSLRFGEAGPPLKKADRLQIASVEPKPVTERMPPAPNAPVSVPPVILVQDEDKPLASRHRRRHAAGNVCTRHNMRKVIVRKSWRCRK